MRFIQSMWRKIKNIFFPEVLVGGTKRQPVNRRERRAAAAIARKSRNNPRRNKQ